MVFTDEKSTLVKVCFLVIEILSALGFFLFIASGITAKANLGTAVGAVLSAAVFIICIKRHSFIQLLMKLWQSRAGRGLVIAAAVIAVICLAAAVVISCFMIKYMNHLPDKPCTVIVLGCRVREDGPSLMLSKRIETAYEYLSANEDVICIASGGKGQDEPVSEAECIKEKLVEMGIAPERIYLEDKSESTEENIENSLALFDKLGLEKKAVIVTSEFHQLRAHIIAEQMGLDAYSRSSPTAVYLLPSYWIRELFGVVYQLIR